MKEVYTYQEGLLYEIPSRDKKEASIFASNEGLPKMSSTKSKINLQKSQPLFQLIHTNKDEVTPD